MGHLDQGCEPGAGPEQSGQVPLDRGERRGPGWLVDAPSCAAAELMRLPPLNSANFCPRNSASRPPGWSHARADLRDALGAFADLPSARLRANQDRRCVRRADGDAGSSGIRPAVTRRTSCAASTCSSM
jgi:hypothetical protein